MPLTTYRAGLLAEAVCRAALRLQGYSIIRSRYRSEVGEIDLLAYRRRVLAVIEVKLRRSLDEAAAAVSIRQRRRLMQAAGCFLRDNPRFVGCTVRFDVMLVAPWRWPKHIPDAWREGMEV